MIINVTHLFIPVLLTPNFGCLCLTSHLSLPIQARLRGLHIVGISIGHARFIWLYLKFNALVIFWLRSMLHSVISFLAWFNHIWQKLWTLVIILLIIPILSFFEILVACIVFIYFFNASFCNLILNTHITIVELGLYFIMSRVPLLPLMHLDEIWFLFLHKRCLFGRRLAI